MPSGNDPREPDFEQANSQLNEGLKSCRAVVKNYRAMLAGKPPAESDSEGGEGSTNEPGGGHPSG